MALSRDIATTIALLLAIVSSPCWLAAQPTTATVPAPAQPSLPQSPGFHDVDYDGLRDGQSLRMACNVFLPQTYTPAGAGRQRFPLIVYLIGVGDRGSHNGAVYNNGPPLSLKADQPLADWAPFILFTPQCPADLRWDSPAMPRFILDSIHWAIRSWNVDPDRVYLTGLSMGGSATWRVTLESDGLFAAIAPLCGTEIEPQRMVSATKGTTVGIICGGADNAFTAGSRTMHQALQAGGTDVLYVEVPGKGHAVWPAFYASRTFYEFLLLHRRGQSPPPTRPSVDQLLAVGQTSPNSADTQLAEPLSRFLPWWHISNCGRQNSPGLHDEILGRKKVFVTAPLANDIPCRLMYTLAVPDKGATTLHLTVAAHPAGQWDLVIRANSKDLLRQRIAGQSSANPWADITADLSDFHGQTLYLELLNAPIGSDHPEAYWAKVQIR